MTYPEALLREMARTALAARDCGDHRWHLLGLSLALRFNATEAEIVELVRGLAQLPTETQP